MSCVSAVRCYAAGFNVAGGGMVLTVDRGRVIAAHGTSTELYAIACSSGGCTAAGAGLDGGAFVGMVARVAGGRVAATTAVPGSGSLVAVARKGGTFTAVGPSRRSGSVLTTS